MGHILPAQKTEVETPPDWPIDIAYWARVAGSSPVGKPLLVSDLACSLQTAREAERVSRPHCEPWEAAGGGLGSRAWPACASGGRCCHLSGPAAGERAGPLPPATAHARGPHRPRCLSSIARTLGSSARRTRQVCGRDRGRPLCERGAHVGVGSEGATCICWEQGPGSAWAGSSWELRETQGGRFCSLEA